MSAAIPVPGAAGRMRGARRAYASRANGRSSRGPKTAAGRQRDASAPFRHGLSLPVLLDAALAPEIDRLAREIISTAVGRPVAETHLPVAIRIAEAMIDLRRVRLAKHPLWVALESDPGNTAALEALARLDRYEGRAVSRRKFAIREFAAAIAGIDPTRPRRMRWPAFRVRFGNFGRRS
jgi:hypothetical protein